MQKMRKLIDSAIQTRPADLSKLWLTHLNF